MRTPITPFHLLGLFLVAILLLSLIQIGIFSIALDKLGISAQGAFLILFSSLFGSTINLPLFSIAAQQPEEAPSPLRHGLWPGQAIPFTGRTIIAINVGGALVPLLVSLYLIQVNTIPAASIVLAIVAVSSVSFLLSRPIRGLGIGMPIFIAPITAALAALSINPQHSAALAYIGGTMGVLIGADLLRLKDIRKLGAPVAAIGGAGTFDGIFITGIIAVLLA